MQKENVAKQLQHNISTERSNKDMIEKIALGTKRELDNLSMKLKHKVV